MNVLLLIVKYTAAVLTGAYGVYATLTDFHENKNGVRTLSKKGKWGISLLLVSTVLSLSTDGLKDFREQRESKKNETRQRQIDAEQRKTSSNVSTSLTASLAIAGQLESAMHSLRATSEAVNNTSKTATKALHEAQRATAPLSLSHLVVRAQLRISPEDKLVQKYTHRLESLPQPDDPLGLTHITEESVYFPNERGEEDIKRLATSMAISLEFSRRDTHKSEHNHSNTDLALLLPCAGYDQSPPGSIEVELGLSITPGVGKISPGVYFNCKVEAIVMENNDTFRSLLDFEGALLKVDVIGGPDDRDVPRPVGRWIFIAVETSDGRMIFSKLFHLQSRKPKCSFCFVTTLSHHSPK